MPTTTSATSLFSPLTLLHLSSVAHFRRRTRCLLSTHLHRNILERIRPPLVIVTSKSTLNPESPRPDLHVAATPRQPAKACFFLHWRDWVLTHNNRVHSRDRHTP